MSLISLKLSKWCILEIKFEPSSFHYFMFFWLCFSFLSLQWRKVLRCFLSDPYLLLLVKVLSLKFDKYIITHVVLTRWWWAGARVSVLNLVISIVNNNGVVRKKELIFECRQNITKILVVLKKWSTLDRVIRVSQIRKHYLIIWGEMWPVSAVFVLPVELMSARLILEVGTEKLRLGSMFF